MFIFQFSKWTDPENTNPVAPRAAILDDLQFRFDFGIISQEEFDEIKAARESHDDDEEEEEE